jgi:adenylate cyclase
MHKFTHRTYSFDDFTLDLDRGCLLRDKKEVRLRPKSFEVLKYLVEHHNRLVSKNDLMHAVWAGAFVTDDSLVQCLIEVRRALGDESRRYVRTIPRRGYIFEAQVNDNEAY